MRVWVLLALVATGIIISEPLFAQCAMCRATLENNVSNGEAGLAPHLNIGILYLFVMPYILVAVVGFVWYKNSKRNAQVGGHTQG